MSASTLDMASAQRLRSWIDRFAALTLPGPGVTRPGFTELERDAHAVFAAEMRALGATVDTDEAGNTIARLAGTTTRRAIGTGSHLDSVPGGGSFDGIAGVAAALEVARIVSERTRPRAREWRFVVFAAEEGARFGQACNGSRMAAGLTTSADLAELHDAAGTTMADAMREVGLQPDLVERARWRPEEWHAFLELHIEQGNVLEQTGADIGAVDAISGSTRLRVRIDGVSSHTGATPMHLRHDALVTAAECVLACERIASDGAHHGTRVTVGALDVSPGSLTTIPGQVDFTVDIRDFDPLRQRSTARTLLAEFDAIAGARATRASAELIGDTPPVVLPAHLVDVVVEAARVHGVQSRVMPSGASHDAQQINHVTRAGMIFVPSRGGLSHVPGEFTSPEQLACGVAVLLSALDALDAEEDA